MSRSVGKWKLPQPTDIKEENEWIPIPRIARTIPFGYKQSEEDPDILEPIQNELDLLEKGKVSRQSVFYREVANWLSANTGRYISHVGLRKRLENERQRKNQAKSLRKWAEYAEKAIAKAQEIEAQEQVQEQAAEVESVSYETSSIEEQLMYCSNLMPGPQTEFLAASEREVLYGGCAGGGKSYAMLADPLRYMGHPQFSGLLLRHTTEELRELIFKSQELYPKIWPGIKWSERKMQWTAPSGARLWMSYLDRDDDVLRYQGLAFSWIGFDELTQWATPYAWNYMRSRLRSTAPDLPIFMRATTNPGGGDIIG